MRSLLFFLLVSIVACGSSTSSDDGSTGDGSDAGSGFPADHPALPQVINTGGPVMAAPKFIAITFPGDSLATSIADFSTKISAGAYWATTTSEYGVGAGTSTAVQMTTAPAATVSDDDIQTFLRSQFGGALPEPDDNTIYAVYYPDNVTITLQGQQGCQDFGGYHSDIQVGSGKFAAYAVMPRCPTMFSGVSVLDVLTGAASHEYIEAATDPYPNDNPAWSNTDQNGGGWARAGGGAEVGDMCAELGDVFTKATDVGYFVQRTWSNAAAAASHDPCVPQGLTPYFNAAPVLPDTDNIQVASNQKQAASVVHIPVGSSQTIELDLFSDADTLGTFTVGAIDYASAFTGGSPELTFSLDNTTGQNGDKLNLTITAVKKDPRGLAPLYIESQIGTDMTYWVVEVEN
ncbi:MAG: hypothetical protein ABI183_14135 [Polyangiaceae bacterium]